jgi:hypothetical protein
MLDALPPLAYDFTPDGLRVWSGGELVGIFPPNYYGNMCKDLVTEMVRLSRDRDNVVQLKG